MHLVSLLILASGGLVSGVLAGLLGIGGGFVVVSILISLGYTPLQAIATSSLVIVISSISGSFCNWRMGYFDFKRVTYLGIPALLTAQIGVVVAYQIPPYLLLLIFGIFLLTNIYLVEIRKNLAVQDSVAQGKTLNPLVSRISTGSIAGFLAGLLGIGGGLILVPLQMLLLGERIKVAIQTSLGVIVAAAVSACVMHASNGNVLLTEGLVLGVGGLLGTQISTRLLPKLPDSVVSLSFKVFLTIMSVYMLVQAWKAYQIS